MCRHMRRYTTHGRPKCVRSTGHFRRRRLGEGTGSREAVLHPLHKPRTSACWGARAKRSVWKRQHASQHTSDIRFDWNGGTPLAKRLELPRRGGPARVGLSKRQYVGGCQARTCSCFTKPGGRERTVMLHSTLNHSTLPANQVESGNTARPCAQARVASHATIAGKRGFV